MKLKTTIIFVLCAAVAIAGSVLYADGGIGVLRTSATADPVSGPVPDVLPPVTLGPMAVTHDDSRATSLLQFDDGTCESGLGGGTWDSLVNFDVPTQCIQGGLSIVGVSAKVNSNTMNSFVWHQSGAAPGVSRAATAVSPMVGNGPCPTNQTVQTRAIGPGVAVINGTVNFFAGLYGNGYPGRDTNSDAGRMWIYTTGGGVFSPTYMAGLGLGGNLIIRVTVEDANCVPVELQSFGIE